MKALAWSVISAKNAHIIHLILSPCFCSYWRKILATRTLIYMSEQHGYTLSLLLLLHISKIPSMMGFANWTGLISVFSLSLSASSVVSSYGPTSATRDHEKRILESILPPDLRHLVHGSSSSAIHVNTSNSFFLLVSLHCNEQSTNQTWTKQWLLRIEEKSYCYVFHCYPIRTVLRYCRIGRRTARAYLISTNIDEIAVVAFTAFPQGNCFGIRPKVEPYWETTTTAVTALNNDGAAGE